MDDRLSDLYSGLAVHATADREHLAALELLLVVMLADADLDQDEIDVLRELSEDWRGDPSDYEQYLGPAVSRVRAAMAEGGVTGLLDDIDARITSHVLRGALFSAAREITGLDNDITPDEGSLLAEIAVRFG